MKTSMASGLKKIFFVAISILSMITSFLFFIEIFQIGSSVSSGDSWAIASTLITGFVGVLILDVAALVWLRVYLGASDNHDERALATAGMAIGFIGSALSSFAYLILVASTSVAVDPAWQQYVTYAMALILVIHFSLVFLSSYKSTAAKIDERTSEMMAKATEEMLTLMEEDFMARIPGLAKINAHKLSQRLTQQFSSLTVFDVNKDGQGERGLPAPEPTIVEVSGSDARPVLSNKTVILQKLGPMGAWQNVREYADYDVALQVATNLLLSEKDVSYRGLRKDGGKLLFRVGAGPGGNFT
ncbi:MAG: hypothetical protein OCU12_07740 [Methanophagales archaeon]|nr:hypothetical protein [Methanophagales archaeon]